MKRTKPQPKPKRARPAAAPPAAPVEHDPTQIFEEDEFASGEALHQAESELGISEWIDPDTGDPADDSVPRIEDH